MPTRREVVVALAVTPVVVATTNAKAGAPGSHLVIPKPALERILEVLAEGGEIRTISYSLPVQKGMCHSGTMFFTEPEERAWRVE